MLGRLFGKKPSVLIATIPARIMPMTRGDFLEDPLDQMLQKMKLGEVCGAGTALSPTGDGVDHVDIEIALKDLTDANLDVVLKMLNELCTPKGSYLTLPDGRKIEFGKAEGLEISFETDELADAFATRLMSGGEPPHEYGDFGREGKSLNLYGASFLEMEAACRACLQGEQVTIRRLE